MTDLRKQFIESYEAAGRTITGHAFELFQKLLVEEFDDDPEKMSAFIESLQEPNNEIGIIEKLQLENEQLKQSVKLNEATILELADMILSR